MDFYELACEARRVVRKEHSVIITLAFTQELIEKKRIVVDRYNRLREEIRKARELKEQEKEQR